MRWSRAGAAFTRAAWSDRGRRAQSYVVDAWRCGAAATRRTWARLSGRRRNATRLWGLSQPFAARRIRPAAERAAAPGIHGTDSDPVHILSTQHGLKAQLARSLQAILQDPILLATLPAGETTTFMDRELVNPAVLVWARETAGLDLATAARKLGLTDTKKFSGAEKLAQLEAGQMEPSRSTLVKMSQQYHRPLLSFYLAEPPPKGERGSDFRTLPEEKRREDAPTVDALVRDIRGRQALVRSVLEEDEDLPRLPFVGSASRRVPAEALAITMANHIGFDRDTFRRGNVDESFRYLRACAERAGVFVLLIGNLGSHHTNINADIFRGFAISDDLAPFVVINDQDAKAAWSFTLLHELAHIWLGLSGISGGPVEARVERYCNDVASAALLSHHEIEGVRFGDEDEAIDFAGEISRRMNVSRALIIYRLFRQGSLSEVVWRSLTDRLQREWRDDRQRKKDEAAENRSEKGGGPNYYTVQRFHLGHALVDLVRRSISDGVLSQTRAGQVLGVRATSVYPLISDKAA